MQSRTDSRDRERCPAEHAGTTSRHGVTDVRSRCTIAQAQQQRTLGQSFVEFALILPVFLLFLAATLDLGRVFYANITLNNAAREGAFQAAKTPELYVDGQPCNQATNRVVCRVQEESAGSMIAIKPDRHRDELQPGLMLEAPGSTVTVDVHGSSA